MNDEKILKVETDLLLASIEKIISSEVLENDISGHIPLTDELTDPNKIYQGKASMLFVDMRDSSKLTEMFNTEQLVKIYRGYIRTIVQAIRYSGGVVRDFMGDGVLAIFIDDEKVNSEEKAVYAARYITTAIDMFLNPILYKRLKHKISCGIGIHTGVISLSKVGMRGKEQDVESEKEFGIAWISKSTNLAFKYSSAVDLGTIFISESTFTALTNIDEKHIWEKIEISKGSIVLNGYIAKNYYLKVDEDIVPCKAESNRIIQSLTDELKSVYYKQLADIVKKSKELGKKEQELEDKVQKLNSREIEVNNKEHGSRIKERTIYELEYQFYCNVLQSGHCKEVCVKEMGHEFWEDYLEKAINAGVGIGIEVNKVKQEISYAMVSIYEDLGLYYKAYDFLVEQANGCSWLNISTVKRIIGRIGYCDRLKTALYYRLWKNDLSSENLEMFMEIKDWLVSKY